VLDNANTPIPNATARLLGTTLSAVTDVNGRFLISGAPVGTVTLSVDGSTSTRTETFPFLSFILQDLPGQNNTLNKPIYLPFINVNDAQTVGGDDPVVLTMAGVPGLSFTIAPHSVTFPDGSTVGKLSLSQVKSDMVPMEPTNGSGPDLIWTLQPAGTRFSVPIQVTLPNTQGLAPGTVSEMYQFDHDLEQFVSAGTAHVVADGSVIMSDPGFGITTAGWGHGPTFPLPGNCTVSCSNHNPCIYVQPAPTGCGCVGSYNNGAACGSKTNIGVCQLPGTCKNGACSGGNKPDNTHCDDGVFCKQPETCQGGVCTGKLIEPVALPPDQSLTAGDLVTFQASFDSIANPIAQFTSKFGLGLEIVPSFSATDTDMSICCESQHKLNVEQDQQTVRAGLDMKTPKLGIPGLSIYVPLLGTEGFFGQVIGSESVAATHVTSVCDNQNCWIGDLQLGLTFALGLGIGQNNSLSVEVTASAGITGDLQVGCRAITGSISSQDIKATGTVTTPLGFTLQVGPYVLYPAQELAKISVPY
jgi:hypothetical protein